MKNSQEFFLSSFLSSQIRKIAAAWSNYYFSTTTLQLQLYNYCKNAITTTGH